MKTKSNGGVSLNFPVAFMATHRATYYECLVRLIPRNGKEECKWGLGKFARWACLTASSFKAGKPTLEMLQMAHGENWSFEMVAAHTVGV